MRLDQAWYAERRFAFSTASPQGIAFEFSTDHLLLGREPVTVMEECDGRRRTVGRCIFIRAGTRHLVDHSGPCLRLFAAPGGEDRRRLCGEATTHRLQALRLERCDPAFESFADLLEQDACGAFGRLVSTLGLVAGRPSDRRVRSSIATLNTDFGDREVAAHASAVGLSESRFRQIFRLETGVSFRRFRLAMRLCRALDLIDEGANLTLAAHESGFSSSAHFSAAFRAAYGVTPSLAARGMRLRRLGLDRMGRTSYASAQLSWRAA